MDKMTSFSSVFSEEKVVSQDARLNFLGINEETRNLLLEMNDALADALHEAVAEWHDFLLSREETAKLLPSGSELERLRQIHFMYFKTLLTGPCDDEYFKRRMLIGFTHHRIGVEPVWYISAFYKFIDIITNKLKSLEISNTTLMLDALSKVVCLDESLALDAYFQKKNEEILEINRALERAAKLFTLKDQQLNESQEQLLKMASVKKEFLSKVSHELRTPLNAIIGFSDLIADEIVGPVNSEQARHLRKIRTHGEHLLDLIDQTIEAAKMSSGDMPDIRPFDAPLLLEQIIKKTKKEAEAKNLVFEVSIAPDLPIVLGDPRGFSMAVRHLLENAVKFTEKGFVRLDIEVNDKTVKFTVSDSGPGIAEEHKNRIFGAFYQAEAGDARSTAGLGMGLTLASQALARMGGVLELLSAGSSGSKFCVLLPTEEDAAEQKR